MAKVSPDHPIQQLLFYICGSVTEQDVIDMRAVVEAMESQGKWVVGPPDFVDTTEEPDSTNPDDQPVRTVGGVHRIYSGLPPWGSRLPSEVDRAHFEETELVVQKLCEFSLQCRQELALELDQVSVGWVKDGVPDKGIAVGLLDEWRKNLSAANATKDAHTHNKGRP